MLIVMTETAKQCENRNNTVIFSRIIDFFIIFYWVTHYVLLALCGRIQFVQYGSFDSKILISTSGAPQGSNLGSLLFLFLWKILLTLSTLLRYRLQMIWKYSQILENLFNSTLNKFVISVNVTILNVLKCKIMSFTGKCILIWL